MAKKKVAKNKGGRPNTYNYDLCIEVCKLVADGMSIKGALATEDRYPTFATWCNWKRDNDELFDLYMRAIQDKSDSVDEEIDSIMRDVKNNKIPFNVGRLLIDTLKWKAAKYYPKMYGDNKNIDHTTKGESLNVPISEWADDKKES